MQIADEFSHYGIEPLDIALHSDLYLKNWNGSFAPPVRQYAMPLQQLHPPTDVPETALPTRRVNVQLQLQSEPGVLEVASMSVSDAAGNVVKYRQASAQIYRRSFDTCLHRANSSGRTSARWSASSTWAIQRLWTIWQSTCWGARCVVALSPPLCLYVHQLRQPLRSQQAVRQSADGNSSCVQAAADTLQYSTHYSIYCSVFQA